MLRQKNRWMWIASLLCLLSMNAGAQISMTLDDALNYSIENSPELQTALMNLRRYKFSLDAQRASLKSRFSLTLNPVSYSRNRYFENRLSEWYTNESRTDSGRRYVPGDRKEADAVPPPPRDDSRRAV